MTKTFTLRGWLACGLVMLLPSLLWAQANCPPGYQPFPEQDCIGAFQLCEPLNDIPNGTICGPGANPQEINASFTCFGGSAFGGGERQSTWYRFRVRTNGTLRFLIIPNDVDTNSVAFQNDQGTASLGNTDYDWILYDVTNHECSDLFNNPEVRQGVRCNWTGTDGPTGLQEPGTGILTSAGGNRFNLPLPVTVGQEFVLAVDNFSTTQIGYLIDFRRSTAEITPEPEQIPFAAEAEAACPGRTVTVTFEQGIDCNSFTPDKIRIERIGTDETYTVENVEPVGTCDELNYATAFNVTFSVFQPTFEHRLVVVDTIFGECASFVIDDTLDFTIPLFVNLQPTASADTVPCSTPVVLNANPLLGGDFTYTWFGPNLQDSTGQTVTAFPTESAEYTVVGVLPDGSCADTATVFVTIDPFPNLEPALVNSPDTICAGTTVRINANPRLARNYTYFWLGPNIADPNVQNPLVTPDTTTTYTVVAQLEDGTCPDSASITVFVRASPVFEQLSDSLDVCVGQPLTLTAFSPLADTYFWQALTPGAPVQQTNDPEFVVTIEQNTRYRVRATGPEICDIIDTIDVLLRAPGAFDQIEREVTVCLGDTVPIFALDSEFGAVNYSWRALFNFNPFVGMVAGFTTDTILVSPAQNTFYEVRAFSPGNCDLVDTVQVIVRDRSRFDALTGNGEVGICPGEEVTLFATEASGTAVQYTWRAIGFGNVNPTTGILSDPNQPTVRVSPARDIAYEVTAFSPQTCTLIDTIRVLVSPDFAPAFTVDQTFGTLPFTVNFENRTVGDPSAYTWFYVFEGDTVFFSEDFAPSLTLGESGRGALDEGTYVVNLLAADTAFGCVRLAEPIAIRAELRRQPNVITPNGDGLNETLVFTGISDNLSILIVDRYGRKVFAQDRYDNGWDGQGLPDGTYYFVLTDRNTGRTIKDYVTILR